MQRRTRYINRPRKYSVGDEIAVYVILSMGSDEPNEDTNRWSKNYFCQCSRCGAILVIEESGLSKIARLQRNRCAVCDEMSDDVARARPGVSIRAKPFECTTCYDLTHRRPQSKPCKCGKRYEPDTFEATELDAHACADLWQYAARELGPDSFAGIVDWL
jgi:hypothetical protein